MKNSKKAKRTTHRRTYKLITTAKDPYWDEGVNWYYPKGWKNHSKAKRRKEITWFKVREYRTWKYNRRKQWKEK